LPSNSKRHCSHFRRIWLRKPLPSFELSSITWGTARLTTELLSIIPVLPSAEIERDVAWYKERAGFNVSRADMMYAVLSKENLCIHLQWHADTKSDPLLGGSVIRIFVKDKRAFIEVFVRRGTVEQEAFKVRTPWKTNEFGFFDLNKNAIFIVGDIVSA